MRIERTLASALLAVAALAVAVSAIAGGPLVVVPTSEGPRPAHWSGIVDVYTDLGTLGVVDNALATQLVAKSLNEWTSVPMSNFRAQVAGNFGYLGLGDIVGANAGSIIGADNGGGLHVIFDGDGTVLTDFIGVGFGVLGIATPEFLEHQGSTRIIEGWVIITGQGEGVEEVVQGAPLSGVITHELGHAIGLAHSQANGLYFRNQPVETWGLPAGAERAGPDQCASKVTDYPAANQVETMYPFIDPFPSSPLYNSPGMATVDVSDDRAALASLYPSDDFRQRTGTVAGRVVATDGTSPLMGVNVIARRVANPFDAVSRISGDRTQGLVGPDGRFAIKGLKPGVQYLVHIDELGAGGFSTPKAILLGPEENWNAGESGDASVDDPCAATRITLEAGETRHIRIAVNGIDDAPDFTHLPYTLPSDLSDSGARVAGVYGPFQSPFWTWTGQRGMRNIGGVGFIGAVSGDGRVIGGSIAKPVETPYGALNQERAALWTPEGGWRSIANERKFQGCDIYHSTLYDLNRDGTAAAGLAFEDCSHAVAFKWTATGGMKALGKTSEGAARANAISGDGLVVGGWEEISSATGFRVGSIWQGNEQMLLTDDEPLNPIGYVGEVMAVNRTGTIAIGSGAGVANKDAYRWTTQDGVVNIGRYPGQVCYVTYDWETGEPSDVCEDRETAAYSLSHDGKVITGSSRLLMQGVDDAVIFTRGLGWMLMSEFLESQGVLQMSRWRILGAKVSGNGKVLTGTAFPIAGDYYQGYRLDLDRVFVCHGQGGSAYTVSVAFPEAMDDHLEHGDRVGLCKADAPL